MTSITCRVRITTAGGTRSQDAQTNPTAPRIELVLFRKITATIGTEPIRHHKTHKQTQLRPAPDWLSSAKCSVHRAASGSESATSPENAQTNPTALRIELALFRKITATIGTEPIRHHKTHKQTQLRPTSNWFCFAKSPPRPEPSRPAITKRTNKPNRAQHRIGSASQNHHHDRNRAVRPPQIARTNPKRTEPAYKISRILEISESPCAS